MSALDSAFLLLEDGHAALHIGSVAVFEGPVPPFDDIRAQVQRRLPLIPRYRQRMLGVPGNLGRPVWVDDPEFDLRQHLRRTALPAPGGDRELQNLVGRVMSQPLDHDNPLWEDWVVEGLAEDRWALVTKVHHSMVDGIAGTDLLSLMLSPAADADVPEVDTFAPEPLPGRLGLATRAARERLADPLVDVRVAAGSLRHPRELARTLLGSATGLFRFASALRPVGRSSLQGRLGSQRRYRWTVVPIDDIRPVRDALGGTLNDVVLAAVALAFRDLLRHRGDEIGPHTVRTLVPVSVRHSDEHGRFDNRVSAILLDLPVDEADPAMVLAIVRARMQELKASHEAVAGETVTRIGDLLPPVGLAAALTLFFRMPQRMLTTVTTNVPGPRTDLYLAGRRMLATYPYVPIADRLRIGVAVTSYAGQLCFGITGDWRTTPDIDVLRTGLDDGFAALLREAEKTGGTR